MHQNERLEDEEQTSKTLNIFLKKTGRTDPASFRGVCMEDNAASEDIVQTNIVLYDINIAEGSMIGELARRSVGKYLKTVRLFPYNEHFCYISNINALFKAFRCPSFDQFIKRAGNVERFLIPFKARIKHVFPKNVHQLRDTLFDQLDSFNIVTPMTFY